MAVARPVEAVGAEVAFRETDGVHNTFQSIEFQRVHTDTFAQHFHKVGVFLARRVAIPFDIAVVIAFQFLDAAAGDEFHHVFGGREIEEGTSVE